jgi:hypothetical protein
MLSWRLSRPGNRHRFRRRLAGAQPDKRAYPGNGIGLKEGKNIPRVL